MKAEELWDPMKLVGQFHQVIVIAISMFTVVVATLAVNIAANVVSPANDFANAFPKLISFRTGGLITGIIGILMQPWRLLADPSGYIFTWLVGYSGGLGSIGGVLIVDYWLVRRKRLELGDLYRTRGVYTYNGGWNWRAAMATLFGCALAWAGPLLARFGIVVPILQMFYSYAWFVGFGVAGGTYFLLMKLWPPRITPILKAETT
jgi:NCS1 family nucleobase:cation symporter-1